MSSAQFNAGQTRGQAQAKTEEWVQSDRGSWLEAHDRKAHASQDGQCQAQSLRERSEVATNDARNPNDPGFLQQTEQQVKTMAQGAIDGVKNTFGMGDHSQNR